MGAIRDRRLRAVRDQNLFDVVDDCNIELDRIAAALQRWADTANTSGHPLLGVAMRDVNLVIGVVGRLRAGNDDDGLIEIALLIKRIADLRAQYRIGSTW